MTLDRKLTFAAHVDDIVKRANRSMGLLIRSFQTGSKNGPSYSRTAIVAAFSNVRSTLEYSSVIWAGVAETHARRVDRVQHKFLIWLLCNTRSRSSTPSFSYSELCQHFQIPTLAARREQHDLLFLKNILCNKLDTPSLLENFSLHVPTRSTRQKTLLNVPYSRVSTVQNGMFSRMPRTMNAFLNDRSVSADTFSDSHSAFRRQVLAYVRRLCASHAVEHESLSQTVC